MFVAFLLVCLGIVSPVPLAPRLKSPQRTNPMHHLSILDLLLPWGSQSQGNTTIYTVRQGETWALTLTLCHTSPSPSTYPQVQSSTSHHTTNPSASLHTHSRSCSLALVNYQEPYNHFLFGVLQAYQTT